MVLIPFNLNNPAMFYVKLDPTTSMTTGASRPYRGPDDLFLILNHRNFLSGR
jgi:hypothetical protein